MQNVTSKTLKFRQLIKYMSLIEVHRSLYKFNHILWDLMSCYQQDKFEGKCESAPII